KYFGEIPKGQEVERVNIKEDPITKTITATEYDSNIQIPAKIFVYRTPSMKERDAYVLDMISSILTDGRSSRMYKKMVDDEKIALQVLAFPRSQEDYGTYIMGALALGETPLETLATSIDEEIKKLQTELISEKEYQKLQNKFENRFVNSNSSIEGIASSLATYNMLYGDTDLINKEIEIYQLITREDIRRVAQEYVIDNERLEMDYLRESAKQQYNHIKMKINIISILFICLFTLGATAQVDRSKQPEPGPAPKINPGQPEEFTLKNGLKVMVVENHKLPRVTASLVTDNKPQSQGAKPATASLVSALLGTGTQKTSKDAYNEEIDFLGASINF